MLWKQLPPEYIIGNLKITNINLLLTERNGSTGEYWPPGHGIRSVRTKTTYIQDWTQVLFKLVLHMW